MLTVLWVRPTILGSLTWNRIHLIRPSVKSLFFFLYTIPQASLCAGFPWKSTLSLLNVVLMLLLLSRFSRVWLCATPETAAHQAPPSLGFSRQEHWSGLPFPSPMRESESEVAQSCPTLGDSMDCSLPGSSIHGICQARVLKWGAIAFSGFDVKASNIAAHWESAHVWLCFSL